MKKINVGDKVNYRGCWGLEAPKEATITDIKLCREERSKYGRFVNSCAVTSMRKCVFFFDDEHWAYGVDVYLILQ